MSETSDCVIDATGKVFRKVEVVPEIIFAALLKSRPGSGARYSRIILALASFVLWSGTAAAEGYFRELGPPDFHVEASELEGPVYADAHGKTLYNWRVPDPNLHIDPGGEQKGVPLCYNDKVTHGLLGRFEVATSDPVELPDAANRPSCTQVWPPVFAGPRAKPIGKWGIVTRKDGALQWTYDGYALYTSALDQMPGDTRGGTLQIPKTGGYPGRIPVGPPSDAPPGVIVSPVLTGRLLTTSSGRTIYQSDNDRRGKSNCEGACATIWPPILAPQLAVTRGDWSTVDRGGGIKQWAFKGRPLYTYTLDRRRKDILGEDIVGWHAAYVARLPAPPAKFTLQQTPAGEVLAGDRGMTIYRFICTDWGPDQQLCDHPGSEQLHRLAVCGFGDPARCLQRWPLVLASASDKSPNRTWSVIEINPKTGHYAIAGEPDAARVWAFNGRPLYYYFEDKKPGDTLGDGRGVGHAGLYSFRAFVLGQQFPDMGDN